MTSIVAVNRRIHTASAMLGWALAATVMGCSSISPETLKEVGHTATDFLIGPEDVLEVVVWRNPDLTREVVVRPDNMISLPLIGDVRAGGRTAEQLAGEIAEGLKEYLESRPMVTVSISQVNSYTFYVLGEVAQPGKHQSKSYTTVLQAIAMVGGFTQFASRNSIQVIRNAVNGQDKSREIRIPVRYDDLLSGSGEPGNFTLKSGDIIVVP